ncbi:MAG: DNA polymerase III subunit beta [Chlorobiota bacterium]|nr:MAG: DNA polymerase III subunit beta [Chlorobiota bacterium]
MHIAHITISDLSSAVVHALPAVPAKSTLFVLEHLLMEASSDGVQLAATDTELAIVARIPAHVDAPGAALVPARKLHDVLRALPSDMSCTIDARGERFVLMTPIGRYELPKLDASEFPELPHTDHATTVTLAAADAQALAAATVYAASTEQYRPAMTGVKFELGSNLVAVATDGYRLSTITIHLDSSSSDILEAVVPARVVELLSKAQEDVMLGFSKTHVMIATGSIYIAARLIDESYPQWRNVIPKESPKVAIVERESLIKAIRRMALFAGTNVGLVRFHWEANTLRLSATDPDTGAQAQEELTCQYTSGPLDIGFNHKYITEALQHIPSDTVTLAFSEPSRAVLLTPAAEGGYSITALVMPMRLS